ncbi:hypothetical protein Moror_798 [Moniliophthora roreri MCA 2997]|uniref:MARVEL domain-containing protein n=1 Tax=Moniliophthora roreri (strain MCA 2997) TaxID=1381753 RepID=V2WSQ0_MONRO|nr:hypothetical protein Moror_798 [Moniliophthora roreri MCA 2997]
MSPFSLTRAAIYGLAIIFGIIVLALNADLIAKSRRFGDDTVRDFQGLGLALGILNILILPIFLIVGRIRRNSLWASNIVELAVIGVLTILWIVESALITQLTPPGGFQCGTVRRFRNNYFLTICQELVTIQALSFLTWILLLIYIIFAIVMCATGRAGWRGEAPAARNKESMSYTARA